jgi:uncharacterized NAD-dependent epimerase/dehydratase family protein
MSASLTQHVPAPYLLFVGDQESAAFAKTARGLVQWVPEKCMGQISLEPDGNTLIADIPSLNVADAAEQGARTLIVGVAAIGGRYEPAWLDLFAEALEAGLDIAGGLHTRLNDEPRLTALADRLGRRLIDIRVPPRDLPIGTGRKRSGKRLLTIGTDCAVGKKYTALALTQEMTRRGLNVDFRATGQTGILIAGSGMPMDSVVADFLSGAAEVLSPDAEPGHWDVIEGQGSLYHPGFAAVTLGLIHGSQPDGLVLCHEAGRTRIRGREAFSVPDLAECMALNLNAARLTNPDARAIGVSINTLELTPAERTTVLGEAEEALGLPAVDPLEGGVGRIVDHALETLNP